MAMSKGLGRELISIVALIVSVIATLFVWGQFRPWAYSIIREPEWLADGVLGLGTFFLTYMLVGFLLRNMTGQSKDISFPNRLLGGAFGIGRGLVIAALITMIFNTNLYKRIDAGEAGAELGPLLKGSVIHNGVLVPIMDFIRKLPFGDIQDALKKLADGDVDGAIQDGKDIIDDNK